jgi:hypothetical protein
MSLLTLALMVALGVPRHSSPAAEAHPATELLGRWHGTSICTKAAWNSACNDEEALYEFVPGAAGGHLLVHAYKIVQAKPLPIGDIDLTFDETLHAWVAEFSNTRVHIRFVFEAAGDHLHGRVVDVPTSRVAREIALTRSAVAH